LNRRFIGVVAAGVFICALMISDIASHAQSVADFYHGRTIRMIIGSVAGAGYDITGRVVASYLSRHIPGTPNILVENMPGASSLIMTNYLYNTAPRDGTAMGMPVSGIVLESRLNLLSREGGNANFDVNRFNWLGTPVQDPGVLWVYGAPPVHSLADLRNVPIIVGATAVGSDSYTIPVIVNALFNAHMKLVLGYKGQNDIFTAAERGEVQGNATGLPFGKPEWLKDNKVQILAQFGTRRAKQLANVPTAAELAMTDEDREMLLFYALKFNMTRPLALPPDVPSDRVEALQAAFDATMKDPDFARDAARVGLDIDPVSGKQITRDMQSIAQFPQQIVERLKKLITP
jgi:tripartite-type tricarboxylate transporter receptor subunit TctC